MWIKKKQFTSAAVSASNFARLIAFNSSPSKEILSCLYLFDEIKAAVFVLNDPTFLIMTSKKTEVLA